MIDTGINSRYNKSQRKGKMKFNKIKVGIPLFLIFSSLLFSQSLAEIAKKEKERREKLKGKKIVVITNSDLGKVKKRSAMTTDRAAAPISPATPPEKSSNIDTAEPTGESSITPQAKKADKPEQLQTSVEEYEANYFKAREYTQLLSIKLRGLWQEFYSMDDMTDRSSIQRQIAETSQQIPEAQKAEAIAKKEMEIARTRVRKKKP
jgi:hypothetical protein